MKSTFGNYTIGPPAKRKSSFAISPRKVAAGFIGLCGLILVLVASLAGRMYRTSYALLLLHGLAIVFLLYADSISKRRNGSFWRMRRTAFTGFGVGTFFSVPCILCALSTTSDIFFPLLALVFATASLAFFVSSIRLWRRYTRNCEQLKELRAQQAGVTQKLTAAETNMTNVFVSHRIAPIKPGEHERLENEQRDIASEIEMLEANDAEETGGAHTKVHA